MSPTKPKSICRNPNCGRKTSGTYCKAHKSMEKSYGYSSELDEWYNHKVWRGRNPNAPLGQRGGLREMHLRSNPYCVKCKEEDGVLNDVTFGGVVDHRKRFRGAETTSEQWQLFTDPDNLQTLCGKHHAQKSSKEAKE